MPIPPVPLRPALSALCSFVLAGSFVGFALLRDGVRGELRALWWALSVLWLLLAVHYLRRTLAGRASHAAPAPTTTSPTDVSAPPAPTPPVPEPEDHR